MTVRVLHGDCRDVLRTLPSESVQCCVTSPPYYGLRDYGVDGQIGLEASPDEYVAQMVAVFRDVRRVLRGDGVCWLNLGDSFAGSWGAQSRGGSPSDSSTLLGKGHVGGGPKLRSLSAVQIAAAPKRTKTGSVSGTPLKPKDLRLIPHRVALALQADGWWLRSAIVWHKPNPMPESITDRPTSAYEMVFLLAKSERYFYDADAVAEIASDWSQKALVSDWTRRTDYGAGEVSGRNSAGSSYADRVRQDGKRNLRNVWTIATQPFSAAKLQRGVGGNKEIVDHFAVMPPELAERCIKAGTSERGCCPACGAPWERETSRGTDAKPQVGASELDRYGTGEAGVHRKVGGQYQKWLDANPKATTGWHSTCSCPTHDPIPCTVLDPFGGAGTTGLVADRLGRNAVLIELNPAYRDLASERVVGDCPLFTEATHA